MAVLDWYEREYPRLTRWLYPTAGCDAEDVAAEAILRAWLAERRGQTIHPSYAYRAARTILVDRNRHAVCVRRYLEHFAPLLPTSTPGLDAALPPDALAGLPPWQRTVMEARLRGDTMPEIAEDRGVSLHAVKQAQRRAWKRLRREEADA